MEDLSVERSLEVLTTGRIAHIAVTDEGGPYVTPISYVILGAHLYMRTGPGRRLAALENDPRVCVEVNSTEADSGRWESVIGFGTADIVNDDSRIQEVIRSLYTKYPETLGSPLSRGHSLPLAGGAAIIEVKFNKLTGRSSGSWLTVPTRPGRL
jgi:nitroimidazol reductase NimA-like FMN-containing flavoprotein (pyridoxamine 5'-phosphate oxidase superfamily)